MGKQQARELLRPQPPAPLASSDSSDAGDRDNLSNWANLPSDLAQTISALLSDDVADFMRFRAVCGPWRRCTADPKEQEPSDRRFHPRRWIMLPPSSPRGGAAAGREFLNVRTAERVRMDLPLLAGHDVAGGPAPEGLLVLQDRRSREVRLLNPLTGLVADLPPVTTLVRCSADWEEEERGGAVQHAGGSLWDEYKITAAGFTGDFTVLLYFGALELLCASPVDGHRWEVVQRELRVAPSLQHGGLFTATVDDRFLTAAAENRWLQQVLLLPCKVEIIGGDDDPEDYTVHMVDNDGELLVLVEARSGGGTEVLRVDLDAEPPVARRVAGLGDRALFVGSHKTVSVCVEQFPCVSANSIYFCHGSGHIMEINIANKNSQPWIAEKGSVVHDLLSYVCHGHDGN
ncbi:hypothetical protein ACP4OV_007190 [Aristida adscensionis]